jgi:3'-phosphoadenosine 5'-phosphosulfate sulfotransferase (PAPS reductase)/FAD synthetase
MKYILSFGGGINSSALLFLIKERHLPLDEVIFADTGNEFQATYQHIKEMNKIHPITLVKSDLAADLFDYCIEKRIVPSRMRRDCTGKFKVSPIRKYLRKKYGKKEKFILYIGIALEEAHRMRTSNVKYIENVYPLVDNRIDRNGCIEIIKNNGFNDVVKSGCWFCPFTRKDGWIKLYNENRELFELAEFMENNCSNPKLKLWQTKKLRDVLIAKPKKESEPTCDVSGSCFL